MPAVRSEFVEVVVFRRGSAGPEYLILQRARDERVYPNLWQFVTGRIEHGETAVEAAQRELQEETELTPVRFWNVPFIASFYNAQSDAVYLNPLFAAEVNATAEPRMSSEHQGYTWLHAADASERLVWPNNRDALSVIHGNIVAGKMVAGLMELQLKERNHR